MYGIRTIATKSKWIYLYSMSYVILVRCWHFSLMRRNVYTNDQHVFISYIRDKEGRSITTFLFSFLSYSILSAVIITIYGQNVCFVPKRLLTLLPLSIEEAEKSKKKKKRVKNFLIAAFIPFTHTDYKMRYGIAMGISNSNWTMNIGLMAG